MSLTTVLVLALGLAMDAFAVAIAVGAVLPKLSLRRVFRLSFHFGLFQFLMPILGWLAGLGVRQLIEAYDHWVAFGLLAFIGGKMIFESRRIIPKTSRSDQTRGWRLVALSVATSIDALAVGLGMAMLRVQIWLPSVIIGVVATSMTALGMELGRRLGRRFGQHMELLGGLVLIGIGTRILLQHLF